MILMILKVAMLTMIKIRFSPLGDVMVGDGDHRRAQVPPHRLKMIILLN